VNLMTTRTTHSVWVALLALLTVWSSGVFAAEPSGEARQERWQAARGAVAKALVRGPAAVPLRDQATLDLPEGFGFIPTKEAAALMNLMGNRTGDEFMGLLVPLSSQEGKSGQWFVSVQYDPAGYIKDDDAKHWDADKLLQTLKDGTEAANADRVGAGIPPLMVTRWIQAPLYEAGSHRLTWSAEARRKDGTDTDPTINYNTYVLGREGYISLNLVTETATVARDEVEAGKLLSAVDFKSGKRYSDFNSSTDKVAAYGLAALVAGVAAKKLGLLALFGAALVKFAKVIFIAVVAFGAGISRWVKARMGRRQTT
jgi:uncharacterized membrane-anchored protein